MSSSSSLSRQLVITSTESELCLETDEDTVFLKLCFIHCRRWKYTESVFPFSGSASEKENSVTIPMLEVFRAMSAHRLLAAPGASRTTIVTFLQLRKSRTSASRVAASMLYCAVVAHCTDGRPSEKLLGFPFFILEIDAHARPPYLGTVVGGRGR